MPECEKRTALVLSLIEIFHQSGSVKMFWNRERILFRNRPKEYATLDRRGYFQGYYIRRSSLFQSLRHAFKKVTQRKVTQRDRSIAEAAKEINKVVTQRDHYRGFDSIAEAAKGIIGAGDYIIAIDDGVARPLNRKERHEFDRLRTRP